MDKVLNAGHLNRYIRFEEEISTRNELNERVNTWQVVKVCKAAKRDIELKRENEDVDNRTVLSTGRTEFTIRYDATLKPLTTKRIVELITNEQYDIQEVQDYGRIGQWMKLTCVRVQTR